MERAEPDIAVDEEVSTDETHIEASRSRYGIDKRRLEAAFTRFAERTGGIEMPDPRGMRGTMRPPINFDDH